MPRAGELIGQYRIMKKLGEGGMGEVFLAVHETLRQRVVLKGLHPELCADPDLGARLQREAEAMARLSHPNIVTFYNYIHDENGALIVMEFVDGSNLDDLVHLHGPAPLPRAIELIRPVLAAIEFAHGRGVIHRDLKPANIMLGADGFVRVMDFGTAKVADRPGLTRVGMTLGTATYMPPEQILGEELSPATDIYAIGVTLFELVTGHLPFEGDEAIVLMKKIRSEPAPAPSSLMPGLPRRFDEVIARCLAKRPADRYASAGELMAALDGLADSLAEAATPGARAAPVGEAKAPPSAVPAAMEAPRAPARIGVALAGAWASGLGLGSAAAGLLLVHLGRADAGVPLAAGGVTLAALAAAALMAHAGRRAADETPPSAPAGAEAPPLREAAPAARPPTLAYASPVGAGSAYAAAPGSGWSAPVAPAPPSAAAQAISAPALRAAAWRHMPFAAVPGAAAQPEPQAAAPRATVIAGPGEVRASRANP